MKNRMRGMWRSLVSLLMALCLVVGLVPTAAFAKEELPTIEEIKAALEEMAQLVAENYDEAYAEAYQYAVDNGYIAYANEGLDMAIAALETLDAAALLELAEQDPALADEAEALQAEALDALEAAKALLNEADILDQAALDAFLALVGEAVEAYNALVVLLDEAGVIAAVVEAYAVLVNEIIPCVTAKLEEAVRIGVAIIMEKVEAKLAEINAAIAAKLAELKAELEAAIAEVKAEIEAKIAELKAELEALKAELEAAVEELKAAIEAKIAEIEKKIEELKAYLEELKEKLQNLVAAVEAVLTEGAAAFDALVAALEELKAMAPAKVAEAVEALKAYICQLLYNATHGEYTISEDSFYVALGDGTAAGESYVDLVAQEMADLVDTYTYENLAEEGLMMQGTYAVLAANAETIAKADLVTLGYGNNGFTTFTANYLLALANGEPAQLDWAAYVGAEGAPYVEEVKAKLYEELVAAGVSGQYMGVDVTVLMVAALEAYAYSYVAYTCNLPQVVDAIHDISPEALVVIVGMYNPMENLVLDLNGQKLAVGEYMQYMVDACNVSALAYALVAQDAVYVDAPAVEIAAPATEMTALTLLTEILTNNGASMNPSEAGHAYIAEQIMNALTVTVKAEGLLGDADGNGVINTLDAMMILQYYAEIISAEEIALDVCDVDGNGTVNTVDAMLVLQYYAELISEFPVEN